MVGIIYVITLIAGLTGKIQGAVYDQNSNRPISDANVIIINTELGTATKENGDFYILNILPGIYSIEVSCLGYQTKIIEEVHVEMEQTVRLQISLKQTIINIAPVTVTAKTPAVKKDFTSATYIVHENEITYLPVDYSMQMVTFQPAVAHFDTAIHVRGGRATEVQYLIDNVSIIDPQTGDPVIDIAKSVVDEVIFLPGGFDAEYGRAMSGVINILSEHPKNNFSGQSSGKTETGILKNSYFGYKNFQSVIHIPLSKRYKGVFSFDLMHTDDWDPKLCLIPRKQRDDYALYGKWLFAPSGMFNATFSGAKSRSQFDRYEIHFKYNLDHYRSDFRAGNLQALNVNFLPDTRKFFGITLSRLYSQIKYGVRQPDQYGLFNDFEFRPYNTLKYIMGSNKNPFGVYATGFLVECDYPEYGDKASQVLKVNFNGNMQVNKYHELKAGFEYTYQDLKNFTYYLTGDTINPLTDEYNYHPIEYALFLQDNVDYEGFFAKVGCRYDYYSSDIEAVEPKMIISPRLGCSFMVTEKFVFRINVGRYAQPPLYDYLYTGYSLLPFPSYLQKYIPPIGNPNLKPEKTTSLEIGLQGELKQDMLATLNVFYKDVSDLIGTRFATAVVHNYFTYINIDYANIKGMEAIFEYNKSIISTKISYTLSWARGTSSYAGENYWRYYQYNNFDTTYVPPAEDYYLDFDQRHRIFLQSIMNMPYGFNINLFGYIGNGFPYTPPGSEGKYEERNIFNLPFQKQIDCSIVKSLKLQTLLLKINLEIINLLNTKYQIAPHRPFIPLDQINQDDFNDYIDLTSAYYHPAADMNHDGEISPHEEYKAFIDLMRTTDDSLNSYTSPLRVRIGVTLNF
jgi:hypothetical protein